MDLLTNEPKVKNEKNKKLVKMILIMIALLVIITIALVCWILYLQSTVLKVSVDGVPKNFKEGFFVFENGEIYVPIKEFAKEIAGYDVYNGEYRKNTEETNKCYIENMNEVAIFSSGSKKIYKTKPGETNYESFTIENPVRNIGGKLYISSEGIKIACNVSFTYSAEKNSIVIYTLPTLIQSYTTIANKAGYVTISEDFSSQKAILQGLIVGQKENGKKGVISLNGEDVIGAKYNTITFLESTKEFLVTNDENKVGILSIKGDVKIQLENDKLELLDNDLGLYIATDGGKKGVLDKKGKTIIHKEYDEIGIDNALFPSNDIENRYLLFYNAIPVKKDGKYGLFNKKGEIILPLNYSGFGYVKSTTKEKSVNNLLIIPEYEGIVLSFEYGDEKEKIKKYGIVNSLGEELVPFGLEEIYSITSQGKEEYYVVYQGIERALSEIEIKNAKPNKETEEKSDMNADSNTTNNANENNQEQNNEEQNNQEQNNQEQNNQEQNNEEQNNQEQNNEEQNNQEQNNQEQNNEEQREE